MLTTKRFIRFSYAVAIVGIALAIPMAYWLGFWQRLLDSDGFMPHGHCFLWDPPLVWLHVVSDSVIALAYASIPITLVYFVRKRRDVPFHWVFLAFGTFIVACGATHVMEIWTLWVPVYWLSGGVKAITAVASLVTAIALARLIPQALKLPGTGELSKVNQSLSQEILDRKRAEDELRISQARLARILDIADDAIISIDGGHRITLFNQGAEKIFGYSAQEVLGQPLNVLLPQHVAEVHGQHLTEFAQAAEMSRKMGERSEIFGRRKTGDEFPAEASISKFEMADEKIFTVILRDITDSKRMETALQMANDQLEERVKERTIELESANSHLQQEISERGRAEEALKESQARMVGIVDSAIDAIVTVDREQRVLLFNRAAEEMFRFPAANAIGQSLDLFIPERFRSNHSSHIRTFGHAGVATRAMAGSRTVYGLRADGEEFPLEASISQVESGGQKLYTVIMRDITERKRAEQSLRASEERFSIAFNASPISSVISTLDEGRYVAVNDTFLSLTGHTREEVIGRTSADLRIWSSPEDRTEAVNLLKSHRRIRNRETTYRVANGEIRIFLTSAEIIELDGQPHLITASIDISERKRAVETLKEQANILDLAPVMIRDLDNRIVLWNTGAVQMYGWTSDEALGKISHELLQTIFPHRVEAIRTSLFASGYWEGEMVHTRKDGQRIMVASRWVLHKNETGQPKAILEINNDITDRKKAEKEVHRLNEELEQRVADRTSQLQAANKELEAFSYSVSHDLRAPLRHINGFSQALIEDYDDKLDETGRFYLRELCGASREMSQLIDDMLQLARVTRSEMRWEAVNLSDLARQVISDLNKRDADRKVVVKIEEGLVTFGDKRLLQVVLLNLLGNAWKFTSQREQAEIVFGQEQKDGEPLYFVRDNGAGFDMEFVDKLFGTFQRLHNAKEFEGTGVGLATVQRIVNRHGGSVSARGAVDQGATFYFTLAVYKETRHGKQNNFIG